MGARCSSAFGSDEVATESLTLSTMAADSSTAANAVSEERSEAPESRA
jgi:hypothetical protein